MLFSSLVLRFSWLTVKSKRESFIQAALYDPPSRYMQRHLFGAFMRSGKLQLSYGLAGVPCRGLL